MLVLSNNSVSTFSENVPHFQNPAQANFPSLAQKPQKRLNQNMCNNSFRTKMVVSPDPSVGLEDSRTGKRVFKEHSSASKENFYLP